MYSNIKTLSRREIISDFSLSDVGASTLNQEEIEHIFYAHGIMYSYEQAKKLGWKNPPHVVLPNGNHTNFYFWHQAMFHNSQITEVLADQLCKKLRFTKKYMGMSGRVRYLSRPRKLYIVGPSYGSIFLAGAMAKLCRSFQGFTYKVVGKDQEWQSLPIPRMSLIQLVDDIIYSSSADSLMATKNAIKEIPSGKMVKVIKEIGVIVNMSGMKKVGQYKIKSLVNFLPPEIWAPKACPLCQQRSRIYSPQTNWDKLANACWREPSE